MILIAIFYVLIFGYHVLVEQWKCMMYIKIDENNFKIRFCVRNFSEQKHIAINADVSSIITHCKEIQRHDPRHISSFNINLT